MEITPTLIYWITRLDALEALGIVMIVFGMLVTGITTLLYACCVINTVEENIKHVLRNILRVSIPMLAIGIAIDVFVPNTKEMAAILVVPRIANSETLTGIGEGVKTLAVEWLEELRPNKGEN